MQLLWHPATYSYSCNAQVMHRVILPEPGVRVASGAVKAGYTLQTSTLLLVRLGPGVLSMFQGLRWPWVQQFGCYVHHSLSKTY